MKILTVVGTRPQFLKLAPLSKKFNENSINHIVVHTGQHYNKEMSDDLFKVLNVKKPEYLLEKKGSTSIQSLGNMMNEIEKICLIEKPDKLIVFGDCDSTIAGAIVAKKLKIYLIHIEAGMRSYNKDMPEEVNRLMTDHISDLLLCSTHDSVDKLKQENIKENVHYVGNLQLELLKNVSDTYNDKSILSENNLTENNFALMTIHREYNTNEKMLKKIFLELEHLDTDIVFPIHPRTKNIIESKNIDIPKNLKLIKPVDYLNMTILERYCKFIITDSGGVQPEAWFLGKKCIIMRSETEWIEPLKNNNNILYDYKTPLNEFIEEFLKVSIDEIEINCNVSENIINLIKYNNKTIFIPGGLGFIGKNYALYVAKLGYNVIILDDLSNSTMENDKIIDELKLCSNVKIIIDSILNYELVGDILKKSNIVVYMCCKQVSSSYTNPTEHIRVNYEGWIYVLNYIINNNLKFDSLCYTSTSCVYGNQSINLNEDSETQVLNIYAATKIATEKTSSLYYKHYNLPIVIVRYSNIYGPGQSLNNGYCGVIGKFLDLIKKNKELTIIGNGTQTRDYTYIDDAIMITHKLLNKNYFNQIYNISTFNKTSINTLVTYIEKILNRKIDYIYIDKRDIDDIEHRIVDNSKVLNTLKCKINYSLIEGLKKTIKYFNLV